MRLSSDAHDNYPERYERYTRYAQLLERYALRLQEAARIDGAKEFRVFWTIAMPLLQPAWTTLAVFSFVNNWNDYFSPLIFISSNALKTLPLALQTLTRGPRAFFVVPAPPLLILSRKGGYRGPGGVLPGGVLFVILRR